MPDLSAELLPTLLQHRLPGLDAGPQAVYPHYGGLSLANLPASIARWLGIELAGGENPLLERLQQSAGGPYRRVILFLVDGVGYDLLTRYLDQPPWSALLRRGVLAPLTSISPSTTASALTTLWTGLPPARHGTIGYEMLLKEYGLIANMILHAPASMSGEAGSLRRAGFDPETFLPGPTFGTQLAKQGISAYAFQPAHLSLSGLSQMLMTGTTVVPYRTLSDLAVSLRDLLLSRPDERSYIYLYWSDIDTLAHRYGPDDLRVRLEWEHFGQRLERMAAELDLLQPGTLFLLAADHGLIHTPQRPELELRRHPALLDCLTLPPTCENRLAFLYLKPGREEQARAYVESAWPERFRIIARETAVQSGLFGRLDGQTRARLNDRVGDWVAAAQGDDYWWWPAKENLMLGRHGGLSREEMLVPLLAVPGG